MARLSGKAALITGAVLLVLGTFADSVASAYHLSSFAARPIVALTNNGLRIPISPPGTSAQDGQARAIGGTGILFGLTMNYALPDGTVTSCTLRLTRLRCDAPWQAERAEAN